MKRIWFVQQKPLNYAPLRAGLGYIPISKLPSNLTLKIYTSRLKPLSGEYYVVEGSRFKAKPVEPQIKFQVKHSWKLCLQRQAIVIPDEDDGFVWFPTSYLKHGGLRFTELDLGIKGSLFSDLRNILLRLNPKATIDSVFYVNRLEPI